MSKVRKIPVWVFREKEDGDIFEDGVEFEKVEEYTLLEGYENEKFISLKILKEHSPMV